MLRLTSTNLLNAVAKAGKLRPWVKHLGNGLYRVARRPTDTDRGWRPHFVQLAVAGSQALGSCDCDGFRFAGHCYHLGAVVRRFQPRQQRKAA